MEKKVEDGGEAQEADETLTVVNKKPKEDSKYRISGSPANRVVKHILDRMLTRYVSDKLAIDSSNEVLKILTSNNRNPYLIWDNGTRAQLLDFLDQQRIFSARQQYEDVTDALKVASAFTFDAHLNELQIGGVFIRIYNEMPTFPIENPKSFVIDLLEFLRQGFDFLSIGNRRISMPVVDKSGILVPTLAPNHPNKRPAAVNDQLLNDYARSKLKNQLEREDSAPKIVYNFQGNSNAITHIIMALKALIAVINSNPNIEIQCIGHFEMLFGFLSNNMCEYDRVIKQLALEIICLVSRNKDCVTEIAACELLGQYLVALKDADLKDVQLKVLETLSGLVNVQRMVKEAHAKGAIVYILDLFCSSNSPQIRETCAELLGKMSSDKLSGPKIRITVCKFLPPVFLDAMIESPATSVQMFESIHEHPELIWNDRIKTAVTYAVRDTADSFYSQQKSNHKLIWRDPEMLTEISSDELVVSGVYLRLFVQNPGWTLRKPKQFLSDLLDFIVDNINRSGVEVNFEIENSKEIVL